MSDPFKLKDYLACMLEIPPLDEVDLKRTVEARALGDAWAHRLLEERFLPRVVQWVQPYRGKGVAFHRLIEVGNRALLKGLRQLSPSTIDASDHLEGVVIQEVEDLVFARK